MERINNENITHKNYQIQLEDGTKITLSENEVVELVARRILTKK